MSPFPDLNQAPSREVIVSIHDVTQHNASEISGILDALRECGIERCSLLVVPNYHHRGPIHEDTGFCNWMQEARKAGHEIVAHGFYHRRDRRPAETLKDRFVTNLYTRGEGEFYDMSEFEAEHRIKMVLASFRSTAVPVKGFIAPAWLLSPGAERAAARLGFDYTTLVGSIIDLAGRRRHPSRSLVYSTSTGWRRVCSLAWNQMLFATLRNKSVVRIGIHPPDFRYASIRKQILRFSARIARSHTPATYAEWVLASRKHPDPATA